MSDTTRPETTEALAERIWHASRADEGTISATGANHVAAAVLTAVEAGEVPGLVTSERLAEAWGEGHTAGRDYHEGHYGNPYLCEVVATVARCPGYNPVNVREMSEEDHSRLTAEGAARAYHLAPAHPHLFCGCGNEAGDCHPERCCVDDEWGRCGNCGKPAPEPPPTPERELSDGLWREGGGGDE